MSKTRYFKLGSRANPGTTGHPVQTVHLSFNIPASIDVAEQFRDRLIQEQRTAASVVREAILAYIARPPAP